MQVFWLSLYFNQYLTKSANQKCIFCFYISKKKEVGYINTPSKNDKKLNFVNNKKLDLNNKNTFYFDSGLALWLHLAAYNSGHSIIYGSPQFLATVPKKTFFAQFSQNKF